LSNIPRSLKYLTYDLCALGLEAQYDLVIRTTYFISFYLTYGITTFEIN